MSFARVRCWPARTVFMLTCREKSLLDGLFDRLYTVKNYVKEHLYKPELFMWGRHIP